MLCFKRFLYARDLLASCLIAAGLLTAGTSRAEPGTSSLRLSGFGTLGATRSSAPPGWGFQRESVQPANDGGLRMDTDARLGLQANYAINPQLEFVGQLLLTRRFSAATPDDAVAWAFAAYRPTDNLTVRAGRLSLNIYQLSDYRSVGVAYPFVRPPTEFYGLLPSAFDGLDLTQSWRDGADTTWKLSGYYGKTEQADNRSRGFRSIRPFYGVFVSREDRGLLLKASISRARLPDEVPALAPLLAALQSLTVLPVPEVAGDAASLRQRLTPGQTADYFGLGLNLDRDDWLLMLEASRARAHGTVRLDAGYVLIGRRFARATPYVSASATRTRAEARAPQWTAALTPVLGPVGAAQAQALGDAAYAVSAIGPRQRTGSFGMRWDSSAQSALKVQYDRTRISARGSFLWSNGGDEAASAHVLSATFDFVF